jgi:hypothetical protein
MAIVSKEPRTNVFISIQEYELAEGERIFGVLT